MVTVFNKSLLMSIKEAYIRYNADLVAHKSVPAILLKERHPYSPGLEMRNCVILLCKKPC